MTFLYPVTPCSKHSVFQTYPLQAFLSRVRGLEFAKEARGKVEGSQRARSKKERDWWMRDTERSMHPLHGGDVGRR